MNNYRDIFRILNRPATRTEQCKAASNLDSHDNSDNDRWWIQSSAVCEREGWQTGFNEHSGVTVSDENGNEASIYLCKGYVPIS